MAKAKSDPIINSNDERIRVGMIPIGRVAPTPPCDVYFMPGEVYSQKNNQQIRTNTAGKSAPKLIKSKQVQRWTKEANTAYIMQWKRLAKVMQDHKAKHSKPLHIGLHFVRKTRALFDHHNMVHLVLDYMQYRGCLDGDDVLNMICHPLRVNGDYNSYSPRSPGFFVGLWKCDPMLNLDIPYEHPAVTPFTVSVIANNKRSL